MSTEMIKEFVRAGNAVFPCNEDKSPKGKWREDRFHISWPDDGRLYAHDLYGWPIPEGLVVIDVDKPELFPYLDLCAGHAGQRTPRGNHYVFIDPGLDERAQTRHEWGEIRRHGAYMCIYQPNDEWLRGEFEPLPAAFVSLGKLKSADVVAGNGSGFKLSAPIDHSKPINTAPGGRNIELTSYLGYHRRQGADRATLRNLAQEWNARQSTPLDMHELMQTVNSVMRYEPEQEGQRALEIEPASKPQETSDLLWLSELQAGDFPAPTFWHDWFGPSQAVLLHGATGSGKSLYMLDTVFRLNQRTVIIDGELTKGLLKYRAGREQRDNIAFLTKEHAEGWIERDWQEFDVIVIDTKSALYSHKESENSAEHWADLNGFIYYWVDAGKCVIVVHHSGKDHSRGARGSSAAGTAFDSVIRISEVDDGYRVKCEKDRHCLNIIKPTMSMVHDGFGRIVFDEI